MSLKKLVETTLKNTGVPVAFQFYAGSSSTYITYFEYNQRPGLSGDDEEQNTIFSYQVDIFSKGDYTDLTNQVKAELNKIGFRRVMETELYLTEIQMYQKIIRFNYAQ